MITPPLVFVSPTALISLFKSTVKLTAAGGGFVVPPPPVGAGSSLLLQAARHPTQAAANPIPRVLINSFLFIIGFFSITKKEN
jgi:hypothetical protein